MLVVSAGDVTAYEPGEALPIPVLVMRDERWQPTGVAVYRDVAEIRAEIAEQLSLERADPEEIEAAVSEFVDACEHAVIATYPDKGYFPSAAAFNAALR